MASVIPMPMKDELLADPFGERSPGRLRRRIQVLGGHFEFRSDSAELLDQLSVLRGDWWRVRRWLHQP